MAESTTQEQLKQFIAPIKDETANVSLEEMRFCAIQVIIVQYGEYMLPAIRDLPLDSRTRVKTNLREMGCDGGYDPIPHQQIDFDASLTPLERFAALLRAAIQFYAFSGPAELSSGSISYTRWGFLHLDLSGNPDTRFYGLHQDMVRHLTEHTSEQLDMGPQTWMQRGTSAHIHQLLATPIVSKELLLNAYFGKSFPELVTVIDQAAPGAFAKLEEIADEVDNALFCEFPRYKVREYEDQYAQIILSLQG